MGRNNMRLFHVSEQAGIEVFEPRLPARADVPQVGLLQTTSLNWSLIRMRNAKK